MFTHKHAQLGRKLETYNLHKKVGNQNNIRDDRNRFVKQMGFKQLSRNIPEAINQIQFSPSLLLTLCSQTILLSVSPSICVLPKRLGKGNLLGEEPGLRGPKSAVKDNRDDVHPPLTYEITNVERAQSPQALLRQLPRPFRAVSGLRNSICYSEKGGNQKEGKP